jgi:hypothetical protein
MGATNYRFDDYDIYIRSRASWQFRFWQTISNDLAASEQHELHFALGDDRLELCGVDNGI